MAGHRRPGGPLVGRLGGKDVLGGTDRLAELAEVEAALGEIHLGLRAAGPMVLARPLRPFGVGLVGEEIVGAQVERGLQRGPPRFARGARGALQQGVEPVEVDRELVGADAVAAGLRPDHLPPDGPAQQRHVGLDRGGRRPWLSLAPQVLGNAILRNGPPAAEEQDLQQLPGFDAAEIPWAEPAARDVERQRSQHPDRHWPSRTRHARSPVHDDGSAETVGAGWRRAVSAGRVLQARGTRPQRGGPTWRRLTHELHTGVAWHSGRPWRGASAGAGCSWAPAPQHWWG